MIFLNVDVDIIASNDDLNNIEEGIANSATILSRDREFISFELSRKMNTSHECIHELLNVIGGLSDEINDSWKNARRRTFNIGVQLAESASEFQIAIAEKDVIRIFNFGILIEFTVYN